MLNSEYLKRKEQYEENPISFNEITFDQEEGLIKAMNTLLKKDLMRKLLSFDHKKVKYGCE